MAARGLLGGDGKNRAQLSLEFLLVYSVVLIVFLVIFAMVVSQRAATLSTQDYSTMQLMAQTVASEIDSAMSSGSGYSATVQLPPGVGTLSYNISVSSSGVVTASTKVGKEVVSAQAYSSARNLVINGTLVAQGSGISVYLIPAYRGSVYVANSGGIVYLDEQPASTLSLAGNLNVGISFNGEIAGFNGQNSYVLVPTSPSYHPTTTYTVSYWLYVPPSSVGTRCVFDDNWNGAGQEQFFLVGKTFYEKVGTSNVQLSAPIQYGSYVFVVGTGSPSGENLYFNGQSVNSTSTAPTLAATSVPLSIGACNGGSLDYFDGQIADVQVYNTSLSLPQIQLLYHSGIGGTPISNAGLIGWWPLNGNANDYSGNGNQGAPYGVAFYDTAQIDAHVSNQNGGNAVGDIVGFTSTAGSFGSQSGEYATYSNANGNATAILTANTSSTQLANITVTAFNGNYTIAGNVVGWWPLNIGSGNTVYDLSTHNNNGAFVNSAWSTANNQTSFLTGNFNGASSYITANSFEFPFTVTAWINPANYNTAHLKPIVETDGVSGSDGGYYQFFLVPSGSGYCGGVGGTLYLWNPNSNFCTPIKIPLNAWSFVAFTTTSTGASIYVNGKMVASISASEYIASSKDNQLVIGDQSGGTRYFNGSMSNIQVYNTSLSSSQIQQLYQEGINSVPISNSGLVGWWPLDGNPNDYSGNNNNGTPVNVAYTNTNYNITTDYPVASFNGQSSNRIISQDTSYNSTFSKNNAITLSAWIYELPNSECEVSVANIYNLTGGLPSFLFRFGVSGGSTWNPPNRIMLELFTTSTQTNMFSTTVVPYKQWSNIVAEYNGTYVKFYLNGNSAGMTPYSATLSTAPKSLLVIGANPNSGCNNGFPGSVSNLQIYNSSLSSSQIQQLYQQGLPQYKKITIELG